MCVGGAVPGNGVRFKSIGRFLSSFFQRTRSGLGLVVSFPPNCLLQALWKTQGAAAAESFSGWGVMEKTVRLKNRAKGMAGRRDE